MLAMHPLDEYGAWVAKSKKEYDPGKNGECIRLAADIRHIKICPHRLEQQGPRAFVAQGMGGYFKRIP